MASQPVGGREDVTSLEVRSFVRGYHAYKDIWNPRIGEVLPLEREPNKTEDRFAVADDQKNWQCCWPCPIQSCTSSVRDVNKGLVEVTGPKINRGAGYGLEIPCTYHFYGAKSFIGKLKELVEALRTDGRL